MKELSGLGDEVVAAVFTPDGRFLISACRKGDVSFWNTDDWHRDHSFHAPNSPKLQGLAVSPDGALLAVAGEGVMIYNLATRELERIPESVRQTNCVAFSRDGMRLAAADRFEGACLWRRGDWTNPKKWRFPDHPESVTFHPDGNRIAVIGGRGIVHLIDHASDFLDHIVTGQGRSWCVAFSPDGRALVTTGNDGVARIWNAERDGTHITLSVPAGIVSGPGFSPDGDEVTTVGTQGQVFIHDARTGKLKRSIPPDDSGPIRAFALARDCRFLVGEDASHRVAVRALPDGTVQRLPIPRGRWYAIAPGMSWVVAGGPEKAFRIHRGGQSATGSELVEGMLDGRASFSTSGETAVLSGPDSDRFWLCDLPSGRLRSPAKTIEMGGIQCHAISPDGKRLATGGRYGKIVLWDATTLEPIREHFHHPESILSLAISPDGRTLVAGDEDRTVTLWDIPTGRVLTSFRFHAGPVCHAMFSPDGSTLATAAPRPDGSSEVFLWTTASRD